MVEGNSSTPLRNVQGKLVTVQEELSRWYMVSAQWGGAIILTWKFEGYFAVYSEFKSVATKKKDRPENIACFLPILIPMFYVVA